MKTEAYFRLRTLGLVALLLIGTIIWTGCGGGETPPQPPGGDEQPPPPEPLPDLVISAIEVFPVQPQAGQDFAVKVYVKNAGQAPSGEYDLAISIKDVSRGSTYPVGTFRKAGLQPGKNILAHSSTDRLDYDPGSYQVHVEIQPFLFEDGSDQNNTARWAFTVPETKPYLVPGLVIRLRHSENLPDSCRAIPYLHLFGGDLGAPAGEGFEWWMIADDLNSNPSSWKLPRGIALGLRHSQNLAIHSGITVFGNNPVSQGDFAGFERRHGGDIKAPSGEGFYWYESTGEFFSEDDWVIAEKLPKGTVLGLQHSVNQPRTSVRWQGEGPYWPSQPAAPTPKGFVRRFGGDIGASAGEGYYWFEKVTGPNPLGKAADDANCGW